MQSSAQFDLVMVLESIICAFWVFFFIFAGCELGERNTEQFDRLYDEVIQFDWYDFPPEIKRLLPILLMYMQEPVEIKFFGSAACTRECFKQVQARKYSPTIDLKNSIHLLQLS